MGIKCIVVFYFPMMRQVCGKPELEIYADDVKCSHGSSTGEINPEQLFYLTARGIK